MHTSGTWRSTIQPRVMKRLYDEAIKTFGLGAFSITAASTPVESPTMYKPGGVMLLVQGSILGRILNSASDRHGRWTHTTF